MGLSRLCVWPIGWPSWPLMVKTSHGHDLSWSGPLMVKTYHDQPTGGARALSCVWPIWLAIVTWDLISRLAVAPRSSRVPTVCNPADGP